MYTNVHHCCARKKMVIDIHCTVATPPSTTQCAHAHAIMRHQYVQAFRNKWQKNVYTNIRLLYRYTYIQYRYIIIIIGIQPYLPTQCTRIHALPSCATTVQHTHFHIYMPLLYYRHWPGPVIRHRRTWAELPISASMATTNRG